MVATCAANETCVRYGTRGYVLNYQAAQQLLRHAEPAVVQVDALISLLAAYEPSSLRLFWCTSNSYCRRRNNKPKNPRKKRRPKNSRPA